MQVRGKPLLDLSQSPLEEDKTPDGHNACSNSRSLLKSFGLFLVQGTTSMRKRAAQTMPFNSTALKGFSDAEILHENF